MRKTDDVAGVVLGVLLGLILCVWLWRLDELPHAIDHGDIAKVQALLDADPSKANAREPSLLGASLTALGRAAFDGRKDMAELLISRGAQVNAAGGGGETALHVAARSPMHSRPLVGHQEVAASLLEHGANPNAQDVAGRTPLHVAARHGYSEMVALLLGHGADVNLREKDGKTPLVELASGLSSFHGDRVRVVQLLLDAGADVNARDHRGKTALTYALHRKALADALRARGGIR